MNQKRALELIENLEVHHLQKEVEAKSGSLEEKTEREYHELMRWLFWLVLAIAPKDIADELLDRRFLYPEKQV